MRNICWMAAGCSRICKHPL